MISKYITKAEYRCRCCGGYPPDFRFGDDMPDIYADIFGKFAAIREEFGRPIIINSGYRCERRNAAVGGSPLSAHLFGLALDMEVGSDMMRLRDIVRRLFPILRMGWKKYSDAGQTFIHIDNAYRVSPRPTPLFVQGLEW